MYMQLVPVAIEIPVSKDLIPVLNQLKWCSEEKVDSSSKFGRGGSKVGGRGGGGGL